MILPTPKPDERSGCALDVFLAVLAGVAAAVLVAFTVVAYFTS